MNLKKQLIFGVALIIFTIGAILIFTKVFSSNPEKIKSAYEEISKDRIEQTLKNEKVQNFEILDSFYSYENKTTEVIVLIDPETENEVTKTYILKNENGDATILEVY